MPGVPTMPYVSPNITIVPTVSFINKKTVRIQENPDLRSDKSVNNANMNPPPLPAYSNAVVHNSIIPKNSENTLQKAPGSAEASQSVVTKNVSVKDVKIASEETILKFSKPQVKQSDISKNAASMAEFKSGKKPCTSWATSYLQSIGQCTRPIKLNLSSAKGEVTKTVGSKPMNKCDPIKINHPHLKVKNVDALKNYPIPFHNIPSLNTGLTTHMDSKKWLTSNALNQPMETMKNGHIKFNIEQGNNCAKSVSHSTPNTSFRTSMDTKTLPPQPSYINTFHPVDIYTNILTGYSEREIYSSYTKQNPELIRPHIDLNTWLTQAPYTHTAYSTGVDINTFNRIEHSEHKKQSGYTQLYYDFLQRTQEKPRMDKTWPTKTSSTKTKNDTIEDMPTTKQYVIQRKPGVAFMSYDTITNTSELHDRKKKTPSTNSTPLNRTISKTSNASIDKDISLKESSKVKKLNTLNLVSGSYECGAKHEVSDKPNRKRTYSEHFKEKLMNIKSKVKKSILVKKNVGSDKYVSKEILEKECYKLKQATASSKIKKLKIDEDHVKTPKISRKNNSESIKNNNKTKSTTQMTSEDSSKIKCSITNEKKKDTNGKCKKDKRVVTPKRGSLEQIKRKRVRSNSENQNHVIAETKKQSCISDKITNSRPENKIKLGNETDRQERTNFRCDCVNKNNGRLESKKRDRREYSPSPEIPKKRVKANANIDSSIDSIVQNHSPIRSVVKLPDRSQGKHPRIRAPESDSSNDDYESDFDLRYMLSRKNYKHYTKGHENMFNELQGKGNTESQHENLKITINRKNDDAQTKETTSTPRPSKTKKQKTKKYRKIKLVIFCEKTGDSSDSSLSDDNISGDVANENNTKPNLDLSFLDDFNVDEIVNSLTECPKRDNTQVKQTILKNAPENSKKTIKPIKKQFVQPIIIKSEIKTEYLETEIQSDILHNDSKCKIHQKNMRENMSNDITLLAVDANSSNCTDNTPTNQTSYENIVSGEKENDNICLVKNIKLEKQDDEIEVLHTDDQKCEIASNSLKTPSLNKYQNTSQLDDIRDSHNKQNTESYEKIVNEIKENVEVAVVRNIKKETQEQEIESQNSDQEMEIVPQPLNTPIDDHVQSVNRLFDVLSQNIQSRSVVQKTKDKKRDISEKSNDINQHDITEVLCASDTKYILQKENNKLSTDLTNAEYKIIESNILCEVLASENVADKTIYFGEMVQKGSDSKTENSKNHEGNAEIADENQVVNIIDGNDSETKHESVKKLEKILTETANDSETKHQSAKELEKILTETAKDSETKHESAKELEEILTETAKDSETKHESAKKLEKVLTETAKDSETKHESVKKLDYILTETAKDSETKHESVEEKLEKIFTETAENLSENKKTVKPITKKSNKRTVKIMNPSLKTNKVLAIKIEEKISEHLHLDLNVISLIHNGRYSKVFKCKDASGVIYAVKTLKENIHNPLSEKKCDMLRQLQNDIPKENLNTVYFIDGFTLDKNWCFLMEYYPKNLHQAFKETSFHIDEVQILAKQLVSAVMMLRNNNVVHSDISPRHILLDASNKNLKVCGFDRSYYAVDGVKAVPNFGITKYRAPEIILGYSAGFSIDVWATALVIYQMATGTNLFYGTNNNDILFKQMSLLGHLPLHMVLYSPYAKNHFIGRTFKRKYQAYVQNFVCIERFYKTNKIYSMLSRSYNYTWAKSRDKCQRVQDLAKLASLHNLLEEMLVLDPHLRLGIEFVYAHHFLHE